MRALDVGTSLAATLARLGAGRSVGPVGPRPAECHRDVVPTDEVIAGEPPGATAPLASAT